MEKAEGSSPSSSTFPERSAEARRLGFVLGGLVAAEGTFATSRMLPDRVDGTARTRFVFALPMAQRDRPLVEALRDFLGAGSLTDRPRRNERWQPTTTLTISGRRSHHAVTIPFAEAYLLPCAKRTQYERWRDRLAAYESAHPSRIGHGPSTCRAPAVTGRSEDGGYVVPTTTARPAGDLAAFLAGFITGEGYLWASPGGFQCAVALGATDACMCELLHQFLGIGRVHRYRRRRPHYDDEVVWVVRSLRDLVETLVPFLDEHLPPSYKRVQYVTWRAELMTYWDERARYRRPCVVDGCDEPRRAKDLCRRHYHRAYGR